MNMLGIEDSITRLINNVIEWTAIIMFLYIICFTLIFHTLENILNMKMHVVNVTQVPFCAIKILRVINDETYTYYVFYCPHGGAHFCHKI